MGSKFIIVKGRKYYLKDTFKTFKEAKKAAKYYRKKRKSRYFITIEKKTNGEIIGYKLYLTNVIALW